MDTDEKKYERAVKQVKAEKGWYSHLFVYLVINVGLQLFYSGIFDDGQFTGYVPWWVRFTTPGFWGISLLLHYIYVFKAHLWKNNFLKRWEEKKIEEFMQQDEEEFNNRFRQNVRR